VNLPGDQAVRVLPGRKAVYNPVTQTATRLEMIPHRGSIWRSGKIDPSSGDNLIIYL